MTESIWRLLMFTVIAHCSFRMPIITFFKWYWLSEPKICRRSLLHAFPVQIRRTWCFDTNFSQQFQSGHTCISHPSSLYIFVIVVMLYYNTIHHMKLKFEGPQTLNQAYKSLYMIHVKFQYFCINIWILQLFNFLGGLPDMLKLGLCICLLSINIIFVQDEQ